MPEAVWFVVGAVMAAVSAIVERSWLAGIAAGTVAVGIALQQGWLR